MAGIEMNGFPSAGNPIDPTDHPATNMPTATEDHQGTELSTNPDIARQAIENEKVTNWLDKAGIKIQKTPGGFGVPKWNK